MINHTSKSITFWFGRIKGNDNISLIFTNDIIIEIISPLIFWNFSKKNGGNMNYLPILDYAKVPKIERKNK